MCQGLNCLAMLPPPKRTLLSLYTIAYLDNAACVPMFMLMQLCTIPILQYCS